MISATVSVSGIVGWVGLIIPHFARMITGANHSRLLPVSMLVGAIYIILEEPTSALDYHNQGRVLQSMADAARQGKAVIFTTHCPHQALHVSHKVLLVRKFAKSIYGPAREILNEGNLSQLYQLPIFRHTLQDGYIIVPSYSQNAQSELCRLAIDQSFAHDSPSRG